MRRKRFRLSIALLCILSLAFSACGSAVPADGPGRGKWIDSDLVGSVRETDEIRLQDDFAAAANQKWIVGAEQDTGSFMSVMYAVMDRKQQILEQDYTDHDGQELKKFYDLAADWDRRGRDGVEPLRPYLQAIEEISSLEELTAYECDREKNPLCLGVLMPSASSQSTADPAAYAMMIQPPALLLGDEEQYFHLQTAGLEQQEYVRRVTEHVLTGLGYTQAQIRELLQENYRFEKKLAGARTYYSDQELKEMSLSFDECVDTAQGYPLDRILDAWGVPRTGAFTLDPAGTRKIAAMYTEENLPGIRAMLMVHLVMETSEWLDRETYDLTQEAEKGRLQEAPESYVPEAVREKKLLQDYVAESSLEPILDRIYVTQYAAEFDKDRLYQMTEELVSSFREILAQETWLSEEGRKQCVEKLDTMKIHVVEPDFDMMSYENLTIRSADEGGSFLEAVLASEQCRRDHYSWLLTIPFDRSKWDPLTASTTEVNSVYIPTMNGVYIFAGVLEAPIYSASMSREELLGGIGCIVGHEITHGFDKTGARYNRDGIEENWLSVDDQMAFSDRCEKVYSYYNTIRPFPGSGMYPGMRVSDEATADMGGLRIALKSVEGDPEFQYDAFFRHFARLWAETVTLEREKELIETDVHPLNYLRVNVGLQQFEEFYDTYGIREGDGMFLEKESRIAVW